MRSCLVLGSGRSGTSMLAGMLQPAGYDTGDDYIVPNSANPKGFFEDQEINELNGSIIAQMLPGRFNAFGFPRRDHLRAGQHWLAEIPLDKKLPSKGSFSRRIIARIPQHLFCFKDPRFCYTLPVWRPYLGDAAFICIFREPSRTANSIVTQSHISPYLKNMKIDYDRALRVWTMMYTHVLERHRFSGDWLFVHYDQVVDGTAGPSIESHIGATLAQNFASGELRRSSAAGQLTDTALTVYQQLCNLAQYDGAALGKAVDADR